MSLGMDMGHVSSIGLLPFPIDITWGAPIDHSTRLKRKNKQSHNPNILFKQILLHKTIYKHYNQNNQSTKTYNKNNQTIIKQTQTPTRFESDVDGTLKNSGGMKTFVEVVA